MNIYIINDSMVVIFVSFILNFYYFFFSSHGVLHQYVFDLMPKQLTFKLAVNQKVYRS